MRVLSLFSGIAGLDLGIKIAVPEARVICHVETDGYCQRVLAARMLDGSLDPCPIHGDVTTFDGRPWRGSVDTICGGFPCQDISNAGRREGLVEGNRSGLWYEFARIIGDVEPRWVFIENVAALVNRGLALVLGSLAELGYDAEWGVFSAADVGAPHLRKRLFLLAHAEHPRSSPARPPAQSALRPAGANLSSSSGGDVADAGSAGAGLEAHRGGGPGGGAAGALEPAGLRQRDGAAGAEGADTDSRAVADAQRAERGPHALARGGGGEGLDGQGEAAGGAGECRLALADAEEQRRELRPAPGERPGRSASGGGAVGHAADGDVFDLRGERRDTGGAGAGREGHAASAGRGDAELPLFPPGPADRYAWTEILERAPWLAPAISEDEAERRFRGMAHGFPEGFFRRRAKDRTAQLRALGNAVCPQSAALAFLELWERLSG